MLFRPHLLELLRYVLRKDLEKIPIVEQTAIDSNVLRPEGKRKQSAFVALGAHCSPSIAAHSKDLQLSGCIRI
jgi:hypothetical protein